MIDKLRADVMSVLDAVPSGASLAVGGFGSSGRPDTLLDALCDLDRRDLHLIVNNVGSDFTGVGRMLAEHVDRAGRPKIVEACTFPLTGRRVVTRVYTDLAVFHVAGGQLRLKECAPGVRPEAVRERTAATYVEDFSA